MKKAELHELSAAATAGPWYVESEKTDGTYGAGEDCSEGYDVSTICTEAERPYGFPGVLFEGHNSTVSLIEEESDEDRLHAWDAVSKANAEFVVALVNAYRSGHLIAAPTPDLGAQGEPVAWETVVVPKLCDIEALPAYYAVLDSGSRCEEITIRAINAYVEKASAPAAPRTGSGVTVEEIADLKDRIRLKASEPRLQQFQDALGANLTEAGYLLGFKLKSTGTTSMWVRLSSGREIIVDESEWAPATAAQAPHDGGETQGGWQPIETAPKDGQLIAVGGGCAYWDVERECWCSAVGQSHGRPIQWSVTHWKSLNSSTIPTPPYGVETIRQDNTSGGL